MQIETPRLLLRPWRPADSGWFAELHADPRVMHDYGDPLDRDASDAKLERYIMAFKRHSLGRWAIETRDGEVQGYAGVMSVPASHPLGAHFDIGWRLKHNAWGHGYATEAAKAALDDVFARVGLETVFAYTAPNNLRSQAVMRRLGLYRDPSRDFTTTYDGAAAWHGWVWVARRT